MHEVWGLATVFWIAFLILGASWLERVSLRTPCNLRGLRSLLLDTPKCQSQTVIIRLHRTTPKKFHNGDLPSTCLDTSKAPALDVADSKMR